MKWKQHGKTHVSTPYVVYPSIRGWEAWYRSADKFGVLRKDFPSLAAAQKHCDDHKAKEATTI